MGSPTGRHLGPYVIEDLIGAGGMGEVYRARDHRLGRVVAIKILPATFSQDPDRLERFEREARAAAALNHPNVLSVYDIGNDDGSPYIVSELLEGESLRDRLASGALPLHKAIDYAIQLARGLAAAHHKGIVHRDLKPENIFVTSDGRVKILDFGLAKLIEPAGGLTVGPTLDAGTAPGIVMGTVGYMSPEQVRGLPTDHRTDMFSFGAVLYEMLSGRRAFHHDTPADTLSAILKEDPPELTATNRAIPPALDHIVRHGLEKEPQQRFQSASDIAFQLGELSGIGSGPAAVPMNAAPRRGKLPAGLLGAAAVLALLVASTAAFMAGRSRASWEPPKLQQVTFQQGVVTSARFAPDTQTIVCAARWGLGRQELYSGHPDIQGLRPLAVDGDRVLTISRSGEVALLQGYNTLSGWAGTGTLARVPLGGGAPRSAIDDVQYADWSRDGSTLAIVRHDRATGMYRLEYPVGKVLYQTSGWISDVRFSRDGYTLAFADHPVLGDDLGQVAIVPSAGGEKRSLGPRWTSIQGLAWTPSDTEILVTAATSGLYRSLHAVSLSGKARPLLSVPGTLAVQDIAPDGRVLVLHDTDRSVLMVSAADSTVERDLSWLEWSVGLDLSSDGKLVLFGDEGAASGPNYSVFLRGADGSPAVRLGDGDAIALSPDGRWALSRLNTPPEQFLLLPTGTGEARQLTRTSKAHLRGGWFPDSRRIAFAGSEGKDHQQRTYVLDLDGTEKPLTPEGLVGTLVTTDGRFVLVRDETTGAQQLFPVDGGDARPISVVQPDDVPLRFTPDGGGMYIARRVGAVRAQFLRLDLQTGRRELLKEVGPADPVGAGRVTFPTISLDGRSFAYQYRRTLSTLYIINGVK